MNNDYVLHSILVVDDEKFICDLCYDSLSQEGFKVETTSNPKTVIKKLTQNRFDLVLTDIKMPRMDGLELVKE
ncbi:MAG: response regulator, partial [bacterium]